MFIDATGARRIEAVEALNTAGYATTMARLYPRSGACALAMAGGQIVLTGPRFPINRAVGMGLERQVGDADLEAAEAVFARAGLPAEVEVCPLAGDPLLEVLGRRGYRLVRFMNVSVRPLSSAGGPADPAPVPWVTVRPVTPAEVVLWARDPALPGQQDDDPTFMLNIVAYHRPAVTCFLAWMDGQIAGKGALAMRDGVATLFSAYTQPEFRRQGVQTALITRRLAAARAAGCTLALVNTTPGSASQRNLERAGFGVAYTRAILTRP